MARQLGCNAVDAVSAISRAADAVSATESTDREVRYAAVKMLWQHYRGRHFAADLATKAANAHIADSQAQENLSKLKSKKIKPYLPVLSSYYCSLNVACLNYRLGV